MDAVQEGGKFKRRCDKVSSPCLDSSWKIVFLSVVGLLLFPVYLKADLDLEA